MFNSRFPPSSDTLRQPNELFELLKAWGGTTLAFAIAIRSVLPSFAQSLLIMGIAAGLGIILHELAHRAVARHFGSEAVFLANDGMLILSILIATTGFLFAAPGAVWHRGYLSKRQVGLIAAAGPATNMVLAVIFLVLLVLLDGVSFFMFQLAFYGYIINALLGLFNMIPLGPIDGAKILDWDIKVFVGMAAVGGLLFMLPRLEIEFIRSLFAYGF